MKTTNELQTLATQVRRDILRMTTAAKSGHPGGSLGTADWMTAMQFNILDQDPANFTMEGTGQDMLFVSQGHITPVIYSTMARRGFFPVEELKTFREFGTRLQGHPSTEHGLPGIRMASGSLGQGMSVGIGAALGKKMTGDNHLVYTLHGDGELQEGQIWEAVMFAGAKHVDNLISTIDYNHQQIDGTTQQVMDLGDLKAKFEAFMWTVVVIKNGNDMQQVLDGNTTAPSSPPTTCRAPSHSCPRPNSATSKPCPPLSHPRSQERLCTYFINRSYSQVQNITPQELETHTKLPRGF